MSYIINKSTTSVAGFSLNGRAIKLGTFKNEKQEPFFELLNNSDLKDADALTKLFAELTVVDDGYIKSLSEVVPDAVAVPSKPSIVSVLNKAGQSIAIYTIPLFNKEGVVVGTIGVQYNETANKALISSDTIELMTVNPMVESAPILASNPVLVMPTPDVESEFEEDTSSEADIPEKEQAKTTEKPLTINNALASAINKVTAKQTKK